MALEGVEFGKVRVPIPGGENWQKIGGGVTSGATKWGYIFGKLGLQNSCPRIPCEGGQRAKKRGISIGN